MARVATGPSRLSFQCRYRDGCVRKSTGSRLRSVVSAMAALFLGSPRRRGPPAPRRPAARTSSQDDPQRLGWSFAEILPAVGGTPVEEGAVAGLQAMAVAVVVENHRAVEHVEELHLPRFDDDLVGGDPAGARAQRRHHAPHLALEETGPQDSPALRRAIEPALRVVAL